MESPVVGNEVAEICKIDKSRERESMVVDIEQFVVQG